MLAKRSLPRDLLLMQKETPVIAPPVEIPLEALSPQALAGVINEFIFREGTDYGIQEITHEKKIEQIQKQMSQGDIKIVFDPNSETVTLMTNQDWLRFRAIPDLSLGQSE